MTRLDRREKILARGKRRLQAAMAWRGLPARPVDNRPYSTMRWLWLSTFPKRRGRAFSAGTGLGLLGHGLDESSDPAAKTPEAGEDLDEIDLGGEGGGAWDA